MNIDLQKMILDKKKKAIQEFEIDPLFYYESYFSSKITKDGEDLRRFIKSLNGSLLISRHLGKIKVYFN